MLHRNADNGASIQEEKCKTTEKIKGFSVGGDAEGWCDGVGCEGKGEMEADNALW